MHAADVVDRGVAHDRDRAGLSGSTSTSQVWQPLG